MKQDIIPWPIEKILEHRSVINFPEYQREPNVWQDDKQAKLIDSVLKGIPIPLVFFYINKEKDVVHYDCIDGQQRLQSLYKFFDNDLAITIDNETVTIEDMKKDKRYSPHLDNIKKYKIPISFILEELKVEELTEMFRRLQLGAVLNAGEKLHSMQGAMRDYIFKTKIKHPFIANIGIPSRRFAKEQVLAQICINSFSLSIKSRYQSARYDYLHDFFVQYSDLTKHKVELTRVNETLDILYKYFGDKTKKLQNRAIVLSAYLFAENLSKSNRVVQMEEFVPFYLEFIKVLQQQAKKGLDYDKEYRGVLEFYSAVTQAAFEPYQIERRQTLLNTYFNYWLKNKKIMKN